LISDDAETVIFANETACRARQNQVTGCLQVARCICIERQSNLGIAPTRTSRWSARPIWSFRVWIGGPCVLTDRQGLPESMRGRNTTAMRRAGQDVWILSCWHLRQRLAHRPGKRRISGQSV